jgi:transcriptional regulator with XRE-family HTH domain
MLNLMSNPKLQRRRAQQEQLREALALSGWSLTRLAKELGVTEPTLSKFMTDHDDKRTMSQFTEDKLNRFVASLVGSAATLGMGESEQASFQTGDPTRTLRFFVEPDFLRKLEPGEGIVVTIRPHRKPTNKK